MFRRISLSYAVVGLGVLPTLVAAQGASRDATRAAAPVADQAARPVATSQANAAADIFFARWLILDNQNEIELAKLAEQKATDSQVKAFAQQLIQDHQLMIDQLTRYAGESTEPRASTAPAGDAARTVEPARNPNNPIRTEIAREPARAASGQSGPERRTAARVTDQGLIPGQAPQQTGMLGLKQELAEECRNSAMQELGHKEGKAFDECFIGMQLAGHMMAINTMKVFERHASDEMKQTIAEGVKTAQGHLHTAQKLILKETGQDAQDVKLEK
jgi:predicted outer membrane protein